VTAVSRRSEALQRGFTLIEVLLAVMMAGIILVGIFGSLWRTVSSKEIVEQRAHLFAAGRDAVLRMADEIEGAVPPAIDKGVFFQGVTESGRAPRSSIGFVTVNRGGYGMNRIRPGQVYISYFLVPIPNRRGLFALRREEVLLEALWREAHGAESFVDELEEEDLRPTSSATHLLDCPDLDQSINIPGNCTRVIGLSFRYYDEVEERWRDEWDTLEDPEDEENPQYQRIPALVEIVLLLEDESGGWHDFSTMVDLPLGRAQPTPKPGEDGGDDDDEDDDG